LTDQERTPHDIHVTLILLTAASFDRSHYEWFVCMSLRCHQTIPRQIAFLFHLAATILPLARRAHQTNDAETQFINQGISSSYFIFILPVRRTSGPIPFACINAIAR